MDKLRKMILIIGLAVIVIVGFIVNVFAADEEETANNGTNLEIEASSAIIMESSTGNIIYEKSSREKLHPASITKIMTLNLIFDAIESGKIKKEDEVTVSEHAASMGGSQVFLEQGEVQTVDTLIKCISMASANDACVAMAEFIAGSEEAFVIKMNEKATELGMENTHFENCCGLDTDNHISCAYDVAIMSRELISKHPDIHNYSCLWMETIIHKTRKGEKEFVLTNTNKLMKQYAYATGLKTGSTSKAGCCLSATALKDGIEIIAVVMAAPNSKTRFSEAIKLLNYGFSVCRIYKEEESMPLSDIKVLCGKKDEIDVNYEKSFSYMFMEDYDENKIRKEINIPSNVIAPVKEGEIIGNVNYFYDGNLLGSVNIIAGSDVKKASYYDSIIKCVRKLLCIS